MVAKRSANDLSEARGVGGTIIYQGQGPYLTLMANGPLWIAQDTSHLELLLDESQLAATASIASLQTALSTKQDSLSLCRLVLRVSRTAAAGDHGQVLDPWQWHRSDQYA
jgi:hypothetical protein